MIWLFNPEGKVAYILKFYPFQEINFQIIFLANIDILQESKFAPCYFSPLKEVYLCELFRTIVIWKISEALTIKTKLGFTSM